MEWLTPPAVASWLGVFLDQTVADRLEPICDATRVWVERVRPDLDFTAGPPADVLAGATIAAGLIYQQAASPSGLPAYDDLGSYSDTSSAWGNAYRLIGYRRPVVA
jgi:hypothetical protein